MTDNQIKGRELLYEGLDWNVGVDGMFINPKHIPYTDCLYEIALAYDSKSKQLKRKEQECEELKEKLTKSIFEDGKKQIALDITIYERDKFKQTLAEIKPILELYANSKIGEEQPNGTYKIVVEAIDALGGACIANYDPRPAKQGLQKISEINNNE